MLSWSSGHDRSQASNLLDLQSIRENCSQFVTSATMKLVREAAVAMVLLMAAMARAQDCGPTSELLSCLPAAEADVQPSQLCCSVLAGYQNAADPEACLCQAAGGSGFGSSGVDIHFAVQIPQKCHLSFPAGTQCNGVPIPGGQ